ncbi:hypothetical protein ACF0H5_003728 [Mactra antiquata]
MAEKSSKELGARTKERVDYKKMHTGKGAESVLQGNHPTEGLTSETECSAKTMYSPQSRPDENIEIQRMDVKRQLELLDAKTENLKQARELELLKRELREKDIAFKQLESQFHEDQPKEVVNSSRKRRSVAEYVSTNTSVTSNSHSMLKGSEEKAPSVKTGMIDINDLRKMPYLRKEARKELKKLAQVESSDSSEKDSDSGSSSSSESDDIEASPVGYSLKNKKSKKQKSKNRRKSGLTAKSSESNGTMNMFFTSPVTP